MKKLLASALLGAVVALLGTGTQARALSLPCCPPVTITCVEKTIICYRPELRVRDVSCTVCKPVCREVIEDRKYLIPYPVWETVKRTIYVYKEVPKEVEREIYVAVECPTPCDSCGCGLCCKPNPASTKIKIKCVECEAKSCPVECMEKVCTYKAREEITHCKKTVVDLVPETVIKHETYCVMVPFEVKVPVPVCLSCGCEQ